MGYGERIGKARDVFQTVHPVYVVIPVGYGSLRRPNTRFAIAVERGTARIVRGQV